MLHRATVRQLRVFEAVARHGSYSRAAEELHLTQPAVSIQVRQLEHHAGLPLFEQLGRKVHLTAAGRELQRHARAVLQQFREAEEALAALKGIRGGRLSIAVISAGDYFFPRLLADFCSRHEGITVELAVDNREEVVRRLAENASDLAIMLRPPQATEMHAQPFAPQPQVIVAATGHPLARRRRVPLKALATERFVVRERGSDTRISMDEAFAECGFRPDIAMEIKSFETIKQAVIAGMGVSFLSAHTIGQELELGRLAVLAVEGLPVVRHWHVVHLARKRLPPVAAAFKQFLLDEGADLVKRYTALSPAIARRPVLTADARTAKLAPVSPADPGVEKE
jgi:LysR family transcriptional regulator, low CO2-responsive transcriptional regulator